MKVMLGCKSLSVRCMVGACLLAMSAGASAQEKYPVKPIRLIVPLAPGGPSDILARSMAQVVSPSLGEAQPHSTKRGNETEGNLGFPLFRLPAPPRASAGSSETLRSHSC